MLNVSNSDWKCPICLYCRNMGMVFFYIKIIELLGVLATKHYSMKQGIFTRYKIENAIIPPIAS